MRKRTRLALVLCAFGAAIQPLAAVDQKPFRVSMPGKSWALEIDVPGFHPETNKLMPDGRWYLLGNGANGIVLSVSLEKSPQRASMASCVQGSQVRRVSAGRVRAIDFQESTTSGMTLLEYVVPEVGGAPVRQKNAFVCMAKEDVYVDIHLSKTQFKREDQPLFTSILSTIRFVDLASAPQGRLDYLKEGSGYYRQVQYAKTIPAAKRRWISKSGTPGSTRICCECRVTTWRWLAGSAAI